MSDKRETAPIFISYAQSDARLAEQLSSALREAGVEPWFDNWEIRPGEIWQERIEDALRNTRAVVILLTPESAKSRWMFFEVGAAVADHKTIIPVLSEDMPPEDVPSILRRFQWVKATTLSEAGAEVARALKSEVGQAV